MNLYRSNTLFKMMPSLLAALVIICCRPVCSMAQVSKYLLLKGAVNIYTDAQPGTALYRSVSVLERDINNALGVRCAIKPLSAVNSSGIVIVNSADDKIVKPLKGWEAHRVYVKAIDHRQQVILQGADVRGTIYAMYAFSEKVLGIPPLWFYTGWRAKKTTSLKIPLDLDLLFPSPAVKYRAWFPNDMDLFTPWRKLSADNNEMWLEAALRLKINTIEWFDGETDHSKKYSVSETTQLISDHGLLNTTHHHSPLNASLDGWESYWKKIRDTIPPQLALANVDKLEDFWRYNVECVIKNKIDMLWVIGFRGAGDHPFWYTFKDAPPSMKERGEVISQMIAKQRDIVLSLTKNQDTRFRTIFYDELSDLLAQGYIHPPADTSLIWTYVATRRDHYPNKDIQNLNKSANVNLGYYFNYQFTSTGSHLAAGEGPWKMEQNFRYVAGKSDKPLMFSVVNAGNIREFLMELSANAAMMWDLKNYNSNSFVQNYCAMYFGKTHAKKAAQIYKDYYNAYWKQKKPDLPGFDRQYIFQDLRYKRAIMDICSAFGKSYNPDPLMDNPGEQEPGRTFKIVPQDNGATSQVDAIINGTTISAAAFLQVTKDAAALSPILSDESRSFFYDNLVAPASYMYNLNVCLLNISKAYKATDKDDRRQLVQRSLMALKQAQGSLLDTQHGNFSKWYAGDKVFGFSGIIAAINKLDQ